MRVCVCACARPVGSSFTQCTRCNNSCPTNTKTKTKTKTTEREHTHTHTIAPSPSPVRLSPWCISAPPAPSLCEKYTSSMWFPLHTTEKKDHTHTHTHTHSPVVSFTPSKSHQNTQTVIHPQSHTHTNTPKNGNTHTTLITRETHDSLTQTQTQTQTHSRFVKNDRPGVQIHAAALHLVPPE